MKQKSKTNCGRPTFIIPGILHRQSIGRTRPKSQEVSLFLEADTRQDALWQAQHGFIEANVERSFKGATVTYDLRRLRRHN